jgi:predicted hydrocarbon binding protein
VFLGNATHLWQGILPEVAADECAAYAAATTPRRKALCLRRLMDMLDREADEATRRSIMEACGRTCIGAGVLRKARDCQRGAHSLDELLERLNQQHVGGGHLWRDADGIHASYDRCYCGSVNQTPEAFSETYCHCSAGWFQQLFETLLGGPVTVDLLGSIIQGGEQCTFLIRT